ncbi:hypothetical protein V2J09_021743 [Rumex salicifolius]
MAHNRYRSRSSKAAGEQNSTSHYTFLSSDLQYIFPVNNPKFCRRRCCKNKEEESLCDSNLTLRNYAAIDEASSPSRQQDDGDALFINRLI